MARAQTITGATVLRGARYFAFARIFTQVTQLVVSIYLARILTPADFGAIASINAIAGITFLLFEGGFRAALVHAADPSPSDYSTVFWINTLGGLVLAGMFWLTGSLVADFFNQPALVSIAPIVGLTFAFSLSVVQAAKMQRQGRYRAAAVIEGASTVIGSLITAALALAGLGLYALAIGPVITQILVSVGYFVVLPWGPREAPSLTSLQSLLRYSAPLVGANALEYAAKNADTVIVGRVFGSTLLGLYNRGYNLVLLPLSQVVTAIGTAVTPALAQMNDDRERAARAYVRCFSVLCLALVPTLLGLAATAPALVIVLWGQQWSATIPIMQILCVAAVAQSLSITGNWLYQAQRRTKTLLVVQVATTAFAIFAIVVGLQWGIVGVAVAVLVRFWVGLPFELAIAVRPLPIKATALILEGMRIALPALLMATIVWLVPVILGLVRTSAAALLVQVLVGVTVQVGLAFTFNRKTLRQLFHFRSLASMES